MAMGSGGVEAELRLKLSGQDEVSQLLANVNEQLDDISKGTNRAAASSEKMAGAMSGLKESWAVVATGVNQALGLAGKLFGALQSGFAMAKAGAASLAIGAAFEAAVPHADEFLQKLREASGFTIDDTSLMRVGRAAVSSGMKMKDVVQFAELATKASQSLGISAVSAFESLSSVSVKLTGEGLEALKVRLNLTEIFKEEERRLGLVGMGLSQNQQRTVLVNQAAEKMREIYGSVELSDSVTTQLQQQQAAWDNMISSFQEQFAEGLHEISKATKGVGHEVNQSFLLMQAQAFQYGVISESSFRDSIHSAGLTNEELEKLAKTIEMMQGPLNKELKESFFANLFTAGMVGNIVEATEALEGFGNSAPNVLRGYGAGAKEAAAANEELTKETKLVAESSEDGTDAIERAMLERVGYNMAILETVENLQDEAFGSMNSAAAQAKAAFAIGNTTVAVEKVKAALGHAERAGSGYTDQVSEMRFELIAATKAQLVLARALAAEKLAAVEEFVVTGQVFPWSSGPGADDFIHVLGDAHAEMTAASEKANQLAEDIKELESIGKAKKDPDKDPKEPTARRGLSKAEKALRETQKRHERTLAEAARDRAERERKTMAIMEKGRLSIFNRTKLRIDEESRGTEELLKQGKLSEALARTQQMAADATREWAVQLAAGAARSTLDKLVEGPTMFEAALADLRDRQLEIAREIQENMQQMRERMVQSQLDNFSDSLAFAAQVGVGFAGQMNEALGHFRRGWDESKKVFDEMKAAGESTGNAVAAAAPGAISAMGRVGSAFASSEKNKAKILALFEGAAALASFARLDFVGGALHTAAAIAYGKAAAAAGGSASKPPAARRAAPKLGGGDEPSRVINIHMGGATVIGSDRSAGPMLADMISKHTEWTSGESFEAA